MTASGKAAGSGRRLAVAAALFALLGIAAATALLGLRRSALRRELDSLVKSSAERALVRPARTLRPSSLSDTPGAANAAEYYLKATETVGRKSEEESNEAYETLVSPWPAGGEELRRARALLRDTADGRRLIEDGLRSDRCDMASACGGEQELADRLGRVQNALMYLGRSFGVEANRLQADSREDAAAAECLKGLAYAGDLARGGDIRAFALSAGLEQDIIVALATLVTRSRLSEQGLEKSAEALSTLNGSWPTLADALAGERLMVDGWLSRTSREVGLVPRSVSLDATIHGSSLAVPLTSGGLAARWKEIDAWYERALGALGTRLSGSALADEAARAIPAASWKDPLIRGSTRPLGAAADASMDGMISRRGLVACARTLLWRRRTGRWPVSMEEMEVAARADRCFVDPASGKPFACRAPKEGEAADFIIYSVGLDGKDDGGRPPKDPRAGTGSGGDVVFWLVDPSKAKKP